MKKQSKPKQPALANRLAVLTQQLLESSREQQELEKRLDLCRTRIDQLEGAITLARELLQATEKRTLPLDTPGPSS